MIVQDYSTQTRAIYHEQHKRIASDETAMERFIGMYSHEYFGLDYNFFSNSRALDVGCGDTAKLLIALYSLGCRDISGIEIGKEFIPVAQTSLQNHDVPLGSVELRSGNVLSLPYKDGEFDFVSCHGAMNI